MDWEHTDLWVSDIAIVSRSLTPWLTWAALDVYRDEDGLWLSVKRVLDEAADLVLLDD